MKRFTLTLITFCITISYVIAQKAKVQTAYNFYKEPYQQYDKAKEAIDEAKQFHLGWWQFWMKDFIKDYYRDFKKDS